MKISRISNCDGSRSARAAKRPKAAGKEKRRETAFSGGRTRHGFRPTGKLVRPHQGNNSDLTGKEFRFNSERIPPYEKLDLGEHDRRSPYFESFGRISGDSIMSPLCGIIQQSQIIIQTRDNYVVTRAYHGPQLGGNNPWPPITRGEGFRILFTHGWPRNKFTPPRISSANIIGNGI
jgi:hypothetical protein